MRKYLLLLLLPSLSWARLTSPFPAQGQDDTLCSGPVSSEVCHDYLGNVVPTTNGTQNLGSSALRWNNLYLSGQLNFSGAIGVTSLTASSVTVSGNESVGGNLSVTGNANVGNLGSTSITASSVTINGSGSLGNHLRLNSASGQFVEQDWDVANVQKATIYWDNNINTFNIGTGLATSSISFLIGGSAAATIDSNRNMGIGTTSPAVKLDINSTSPIGSMFNTQLRATAASGEAIVSSTSAGGFASYSNGSSGSKRNWGWFTNYNTDGDMAFLVSNSSNTSPYLTGSTKFSILSSGRTGIGTVAPVGILHVLGSVPTSGNADPVIIQTGQGASGANGGAITLNTGSNGSGGANGNIYLAVGDTLTNGIPASPIMIVQATSTIKLPQFGTPTGKILCLTADGVIGHCTGSASCTSTCTCTCTSN